MEELKSIKKRTDPKLDILEKVQKKNRPQIGGKKRTDPKLRKGEKYEV